MKYIDSHAHVNFQAFERDWMDVQQRTVAADVGTINVGSQLETSRKAIHIAEVFNEKPVWAAIGQHPIHAIRHRFDAAAFRELAEHPKVVAIGEVGLDYFRLGSHFHDESETAEQHGSSTSLGEQLGVEDIKDRQTDLFSEFITISRDVRKPLILHMRDAQGSFDAYDDVLSILKNTGSGIGVAHCFGADWVHAKQFLDLGFHIGITGIVTFPKSDLLAEVVRNTSLERLLIETDSPYLTPAPHRGKRNEPLYTEYVGRKVAELKGITAEEVFQQTTENAVELFHISNL